MKREFKNIPGIYKITNLINGKVYIGQSVKLLSRISEHKRANGGQIISKAIGKYGVENFKFEVLKYCDKDNLDYLEIKYITENNSIVPNGYNVCVGGKILCIHQKK
jgi:group I intron endonuclease